jgi:L-alanine-DL-glutamate epimerase-like enolase superfamily enzyme
MKVVSLEPIVVSVPYVRTERSSKVERDGVTDVLVRVSSDDGLIGWGEACGGPDVASVAAAIRAMEPFVIGRDPWDHDAMRADVYHRGIWELCAPTANFAWAGIDMALWDLCGKAVDQPLHRLFGGLARTEVSYFYYLAQGPAEEVAAECTRALDAGYNVFYLKVGIDFERELEMVAAARDAIGTGPRLRLDANGAWSPAEGRRYLDRLAAYDIDFVEQPVREHPTTQMAELRATSPIPIAANEGLWTEADAYQRIRGRTADIFCFSPHWVGSLASFHRLAHVAAFEGLQVCKHTHGELGISAAACHQLLLTLPNIVEGHQQTAHLMSHDVLRERLPIETGPIWPVPEGPGLGVSVDENGVAEASARYRDIGQFLPYKPRLQAL